MNLEEERTEVEEATPTTEEKEEKPTEPEEKPTVRTYTQEELDTAVGKGTASFQTQATIAKQATAVAQANVEALKAAQVKGEEDIRFLEQKLEGLADERFAEDPEAVRGFKNTLAQELRERKLIAKEESLKLVEAEQEGFRQAYVMGEKALELKKQYQIPSGLLEACTSAEQMETIAKAFPEVEEVKKEEPKPKFDSGLSSGTGVDLSKMSARELIQHGIDKAKKK